jgi:hypothetical protein
MLSGRYNYCAGKYTRERVMTIRASGVDFLRGALCYPSNDTG